MHEYTCNILVIYCILLNQFILKFVFIKIYLNFEVQKFITTRSYLLSRSTVGMSNY